LRLLQSSEHDGDIGAVDVGVQQSDLVAEFYQGQGEIDGDRGFANATFAAGDRD